MLNEVVPEGRQRVHASQGEQRVGQITVNVLGGVKNGLVRFHAEINLENSEIECPSMPDKGHDTDDGDDEHQCV